MKAISLSFLFVLFFVVDSANAQCMVTQTAKNSEISKQFEYDANGTLRKAILFKNGKRKGYNTYTHNPAGLRIAVSKHKKSGAIKTEEIYEYNDKGLLIKITEKKGERILEEHIFVYKKGKIIERQSKTRNKKGLLKTKVAHFEWQNGCITQCKSYRKEGQELELKKTTIYTYDNKNNPHYGKGHSVKNLSKHNVLTKVEKDRFQLEDKNDSYTAEIQYNAQGFPTEIKRTYTSGKASVWTYVYQCK